MPDVGFGLTTNDWIAAGSTVPTVVTVAEAVPDKDQSSLTVQV